MFAARYLVLGLGETLARVFWPLHCTYIVFLQGMCTSVRPVLCPSTLAIAW